MGTPSEKWKHNKKKNPHINLCTANRDLQKNDKSNLNSDCCTIQVYKPIKIQK